MRRLPGATLAEVLTVLAIVSLVTGALLSVSRRSAGAEVADQTLLQAQRRINQHRLNAIRTRELAILPAPEVLGHSSCNQVPIIALPDGSVLAEPLCVNVDGEELFYSVHPADGALVSP